MIRSVLRTAAPLCTAVWLAGCVSDAAIAPDGAADAKRRADVRLELANAYFADGKPAIALQEVEQALALDPQRADALGLRGLALQQLGEPERAVQSLQQALRLAPGDPGLQNNLGWVLCENGQAAKAMPWFDKALAQRGYGSPEKAAMNAGTCSLKLGDAQRAESYFRRALAADPGLLAAHSSLARLAFDAGDYARARTHLLPVISSERATADDFLLAIRTERKLGDRAAEQSLATQWQRRLPDSPQWRAYQLGNTDER